MSAAAAGLQLRGLSKRFGSAFQLRPLDLRLEPGQILAVTGPSGAGKTSLARLISGLEYPDSGELWAAGKALNGLRVQQRDVAYMFESYALYPHLSVADNIASPLRSPRYRGRYSAAQLNAKVAELIDFSQLSGLQQRLPGALSGGQKQRVALCRALVQTPALFLFDEPLSHLDAKLRYQLRSDIVLRQRAGASLSVWFTPDALEALAVGDQVAVLIDGALRQCGTPDEVYQNPADCDVARLIGDPPINLLPGRLRRSPHSGGDRLYLSHAGGDLQLPPALQRRLGSMPEQASLTLGIRPTAMSLPAAPEEPSLQGVVYAAEPFGKYSVVTVKLNEDFLKVKTRAALSRVPAAGEAMRVGVDADQLLAFDSDSGKRLSPDRAGGAQDSL